MPPELGQAVLNQAVRIVQHLCVPRQFQLHGKTALPAPGAPEKQVQLVLGKGEDPAVMHDPEVNVSRSFLTAGSRAEQQNPSNGLSAGLENTIHEPAVVNF